MINADYIKIGQSDIDYVFAGQEKIWPVQPPTPSYDSQYLTIEVLERVNLSFTSFNRNNVLYFSKDNGSTWQKYQYSFWVDAGEKIMFKGSMTPDSSQYRGVGQFSVGVPFVVEGNVMSLLYNDNFRGKSELTGYSFAFAKLFYNSSGLTSCENLVLPATILSDSCYASMFYRCTSLAKVPQLPATTLNVQSYQYMFYGCTSLSVAPQLPATTLAEGCYWGMFYGCTSLTTPPQLPALSLAKNCYYNMFYDCTSLTTAPVLPAETLVTYCYRGMFYNCLELNEITCLAVNIPSYSYCTENWVLNVASIGTFYKNPSMANWPSGYNGIPSNWTVADYSS